MWEELQRQLDEKGLSVRKGVVQDASFITSDPGHAPADKPRGGEARVRRSRDGSWAKKGGHAYFGYKLHVKKDNDFGLIGSGLFYTFPIVIWMLVMADLIEVKTLKDNRKQLFVALVIVTAVLTPDPTPFSMLLMSIPFYLLYEVTIQVLGRLKKKPGDKVLESGLKASKELLMRNQSQCN